MSRAHFCFYMWADLIPRPGCTSESCGICQKYNFLYPRPTVLWKLSHVTCPRQASQCLCCRARLEKHRCRALVLKRWCWMLVSDSPGNHFQNTCPLPQVILIHPPTLLETSFLRDPRSQVFCSTTTWLPGSLSFNPGILSLGPAIFIKKLFYLAEFAHCLTIELMKCFPIFHMNHLILLTF